MPPPKVDALAALGPLIELGAKGGAAGLAFAALALQMWLGQSSIGQRIDVLDASMSAKIEGVSVRLSELERRAAVAEALREREDRERERPPALPR